MQRFLNPTEETSDEYLELSSDPLNIPRSSKDSHRVVSLSSDAGLYEYRPPIGLNVKRVKSESSGKVLRSASKKASLASAVDEQTIFLKSEPIDEETLDESDNMDVLYDIETNFDDSIDGDIKSSDTIRKVNSKGDGSTTNENDSKIMQIKPVRTNKVRLGYTSANKGKTNTIVNAKSKASDSGSKENASVARSPKTKTNAKGEPKQPKKCEICGNEYMYQHALERYTSIIFLRTIHMTFFVIHFFVFFMTFPVICADTAMRSRSFVASVAKDLSLTLS